MHQYRSLWFTLIELLIVIVIIWVLAVALIPRIKWIQTQAKMRTVDIQMRDFNTALVMANVNNPQSLLNITQNWCSDCDCRSETDLRSLPYNHICRQNWRSALQKLAIAAWMNSGALMDLQSDPRWSPYQLDENEWEYWAHGTNCVTDSFFSVGPDWSRWWTDNITYNPRPVFCPGAY